MHTLPTYLPCRSEAIQTLQRALRQREATHGATYAQTASLPMLAACLYDGAFSVEIDCFGGLSVVAWLVGPADYGFDGAADLGIADVRLYSER